MKHSSNDLLLACVWAAIAGILVVLAPGVSSLRFVFGLPLVLVLPGYALTAALFARQKLTVPERILFSMGLSLVVAIVGGLIFNTFHIRLQNGTWAILLVGITFGASIVARRRQYTSLVVLPQLNINLTSWQFSLLGLAVLVAIGAIELARTPIPARDIEGYTLFWMKPVNDHDASTVHIGIQSMELMPVQYNLKIVADGQVIREWYAIQLAPDEKWEVSLPLPVSSPEHSIVEGFLYRLDAPDVIYRHVTLRREP